MRIFRVLKLIVGNIYNSDYFYCLLGTVWTLGVCAYLDYFTNIDKDWIAFLGGVSGIIFLGSLYVIKWLSKYLYNVWKRAGEDENS